MALGVQASWGLGLASLKTSFDFSKQDDHARATSSRYTQAYYTVDLDAPPSPSALFAPTVSLADVQGKMDETRPPVYVVVGHLRPHGAVHVRVASTRRRRWAPRSTSPTPAASTSRATSRSPTRT